MTANQTHDTGAEKQNTFTGTGIAFKTRQRRGLGRTSGSAESHLRSIREYHGGDYRNGRRHQYKRPSP